MASPWSKAAPSRGAPRPRSRRLRIALGVVAQAGLIGEILRPTDVGGIGILDDALPLLHRAAHHRGSPSPRWVTLGIARAPAVDEGAGIGGVGQDGANRRFGGLTPSDVIRAHAAAVAPRQEDLLLLAVPQDPDSGAQFLKLAEDEPDHMLNLLVGIFDDALYPRGAPVPWADAAHTPRVALYSGAPH